MADIKPADLVAKFQYALDNKWGYIYGATCETWTSAKQSNLVNTFVTKYGADWKNNASAKKQDKYYGAVYGSKWVNHTVTDCSGLFAWAFKQLGGYMYHGSNTMYNKYCAAKGVLKNGVRTDGMNLKIGTAVFTGTESNRGHVGLYIGNGWVIEAQGTQAGVVKTKVTLTKWTWWGELTGVDYGNTSPATTTQTSPAQEETKGLTAMVNATRVALRSSPSTSGSVLTRVDKGETVQVLDDTQWTRISYKGKTGYMMTKFLDI